MGKAVNRPIDEGAADGFVVAVVVCSIEALKALVDRLKTRRLAARARGDAILVDRCRPSMVVVCARRGKCCGTLVLNGVGRRCCSLVFDGRRLRDHDRRDNENRGARSRKIWPECDASALKWLKVLDDVGMMTSSPTRDTWNDELLSEVPPRNTA